MGVRWTVLASGSSANSSLLEISGAGILLDIGLGPRELTNRLRSVGSNWKQLRAVVLTHTHSDHWNCKSLARLVELQIPFYCHREHVRHLRLRCAEFDALLLAKLVRFYSPDQEFIPIDELDVCCRPLRISHDGGATFGFRWAGGSENGGQLWKIGYAADLGTWDSSLVDALADVDLLAIEFNHDIDLLRASGRPPWLISRIAGNHGHLSNVQGAQFLAECARRSTAGRLRNVIQLHLSRECNRPELASSAASQALARLQCSAKIHTAEQNQPGTTIRLTDASDRTTSSIKPVARSAWPAAEF